MDPFKKSKISSTFQEVFFLEAFDFKVAGGDLLVSVLEKLAPIAFSPIHRALCGDRTAVWTDGTQALEEGRVGLCPARWTTQAGDERSRGRRALPMFGARIRWVV